MIDEKPTRQITVTIVFRNCTTDLHNNTSKSFTRLLVSIHRKRTDKQQHPALREPLNRVLPFLPANHETHRGTTNPRQHFPHRRKQGTREQDQYHDQHVHRPGPEHFPSRIRHRYRFLPAFSRQLTNNNNHDNRSNRPHDCRESPPRYNVLQDIVSQATPPPTSKLNNRFFGNAFILGSARKVITRGTSNITPTTVTPPCRT